MKLTSILILSVCVLSGCGSTGNGNDSSVGVLSGNWQLTLIRHNDSTQFPYSGFLLQSGSSISGSLILNAGNGCGGVGPVTGTVNGQTFQMDVNQFGGDLILTGGVPAAGSSGGSTMSGQFSTLANGCNFFSSSTGTWTAFQVAPISGSFHGTFVSPTNGTLAVTGTLNQGPNIGSSNAQLTGTITASNSTTPFCPYLTTGTLSGVISGTTVMLNIYGPNGAQMGAIPAGSPPDAQGVVTPDGKSLSGSYVFSELSLPSCPEEQGNMSITLP